MNLYAYCGNNSLNFVDPFGQREVPLTHTVTIPITAVTNPYDVTSQNAFTIIDGWLEGTVGFWDDFWGTYEYTEGVVQSRYSEWFLDTVEIDGDNFIINGQKKWISFGYARIACGSAARFGYAEQGGADLSDKQLLFQRYRARGEFIRAERVW